MNEKSSDTSKRKVTRQELEENNGKDGKPIWVAVKGTVYDISESQLWKDGRHMNTHEAGHELSLAIQAAPHSTEVFEDFEVVGDLVDVEETHQSEFPEPPDALAKVLALHPHPMTVHFPIALSISAALFTFLFLVTSREAFETVGLYNLILGTIATPVAISMGLLSWYYNYGATWTRIYRWKTGLSIQLAVFEALALIIYATAVHGSAAFGFWHWAYCLLVLALGPTVMGLGYFGGKITFPS